MARGMSQDDYHSLKCARVKSASQPQETGSLRHIENVPRQPFKAVAGVKSRWGHNHEPLLQYSLKGALSDESPALIELAKPRRRTF
jgi:hypothetical protein